MEMVRNQNIIDFFFSNLKNDIINLKVVILLNLSNKNVLVTGSAKGLGKSLIEEFAKNKCNVVISYNKSKKEAEMLEKYIKEKYNVKVLCVNCDVTNEESIKKSISYIVENFGNLDIIINNAAYAQDNYIDEKTKEEFMRVIETNLIGPFLICKYAYKYMNNGVIVNISSKDATSTYNDISIDYCASKAGLNSLTQTLSLALKNIKVISVMPGWIDTESVQNMNPEYLKKELKRINQSKLSTPKNISKQIIDIIKNEKINTGSIIELED